MLSSGQNRRRCPSGRGWPSWKLSEPVLPLRSREKAILQFSVVLRLSFRETNPGFTAPETPLSATLAHLGALFLVCCSLSRSHRLYQIKCQARFKQNVPFLGAPSPSLLQEVLFYSWKWQVGSSCAAKGKIKGQLYVLNEKGQGEPVCTMSWVPLCLLCFPDCALQIQPGWPRAERTCRTHCPKLSK